MNDEHEPERTEEEELAALKASHGKIDDAIRDHISELGVEGLVTGWFLGASVTTFDEGEEYDGLYATQSEGLSKWTLIGLATKVLDSAKGDSDRHYE